MVIFNDPNDWSLKGVGTMTTPFNIEAILQACPNLYAAWKEHPFYLTKAADGRVILRPLADAVDETGPSA